MPTASWRRHFCSSVHIMQNNKTRPGERQGLPFHGVLELVGERGKTDTANGHQGMPDIAQRVGGRPGGVIADSCRSTEAEPIKNGAGS